MAKDVLITPASGSIEIKNDADIQKVTIVADNITTSDKVLTLPNKTGTLAITTDLPFLEEKEYTNVLITANDTANGYLDFIKVIPNNTTGVWTVKYQFEVTPTVVTNTAYTGVFDCEISGYGTSGNVYKIFNSFNGNVTLIYYHVLTFAKTENMATDGHRIGIRLASASNPTTIARNYKVRIIDTKNCTATLLSSMTLNPYYQTADAVLKAKYNSAWALNATGNGLQESGDSDNTQIVAYYVQPIAGPAGMAYHSIIAENMLGTFESLKTPSSISASNVTLVPNNTKFKLGKPLLWYTGTTISQGTRGDSWATHTQYVFDARYVSNYYGTSGVTAIGPYNDAWMKINIDLSDYSFTPQSVVIRTSDITTSGYYILIGHAYNASAYQITLLPESKIYYYDSTTQVFSLVSLTRDATTTDSGLMSATDKTKLDGIAAGAQVGTVTSITAGTGLTGGTITGSGTLAVSYGTTAGTAAQGNDSRLSDARTPTAHVLNSASHTVSGLTTGHFLKATGATSFGFAAHGLTYSDVNAAPTAGSSSITTLGTIGTGTWQGSIINSTYGGTGVNNGGRTLAVNTNSGTLAFTNASTTLTVANTASISGTNTGDQTTITGNAGSATYASAVTTTAENTGTTSRYILFADAVSGNQALKTDTGLTYHPTNNALTASTFIGALTGNADTATKLGTSTVGSTQLPIYLNAGTATAITQADLRIGLFGTTAIGSASQPIYLAANGVPTAGNTIPTVYNSTLTITAGDGLTTGGTFTTNQSSSTAVTVALGTPGDVTTSTTNSVSSTSHTHALVLPQSIATTATPTFSGVNLGAGSNTWTIDDATSNTLTFKLGGVSKFTIGTSSSGTSGNFSANYIEGNSLYSLSTIIADDYIESSTDITAQGNITGSLLTGGLAYSTTAPTANNTNGLKIYVGSTDPVTKYTGWLYIIT